MKLPRRKALVVAGLAGVTTLLVGSAVLAMTVQGGFGMASANSDVGEPSVVTEVQYDDTVVVVPDAPAAPESGNAAPAAAAAGPSSSSAPAEAPSAAPAPAPAASYRSAPQSAAPAANQAPESESHAAPTPKPTTPTTQARTEPEDDEEAARPAPPKPAGCVGGVLEDNGVWNCQH
jgi:hypothetical protein